MLTFAGISSRRTAGIALVACIAAAAPLTAQDRSLTADFPEVYRAGGLKRARLGAVRRPGSGEL